MFPFFFSYMFIKYLLKNKMVDVFSSDVLMLILASYVQFW